MNSLTKNLTSVILRVNVSKDVGTGHFSRCVNIDKELDATCRLVFVISNSSDIKITSSLIKENWQIITLPPEIDFIEDAQLTVEYALNEDAKLIITDLCSGESLCSPESLFDYHKYMRSYSSPFIMSIEDCRMSGYSSNLALVWNAGSKFNLNNKNIFDCTVYSGLKYFISSPDIYKVRDQNRTIKEIGKNVLVFLSGSDPNNVNKLIAQSFYKYMKHDINVKIIVSSRASKRSWDFVKKICRNIKVNIELLDISPNIYELLLWADVAIVGEGLIKYDAAAMGTPGILITQLDHSNNLIKQYENIKCGIHFNDTSKIDKKQLYEYTINLLKDCNLRKRMSTNGMKIIDGKGFNRIFNQGLRKVINDE